MLKNTVEKLLQEALQERPDLFLIDFKMTPDNAITIVIDGDNGVLVEDCMFVSRAIEHNIDRDIHDFSLEVFSAGASTPLSLKRQYKKHIGRNLEINTVDHKNIEGKLIEVNEDNLLLSREIREPKPIGKGKITVTKMLNVAFETIKEAKVKIKF